MMIIKPLIVTVFLIGLNGEAHAAELPEWFVKAYAELNSEPYYNYELTFDDSEYTGVLRVDISSAGTVSVESISPIPVDQNAKYRANIEAIEASINPGSHWCLSLLDEKPKALQLISESESELIFSTLFEGAPNSQVHMEFTLNASDNQILKLRKWAPGTYKPAPFTKFKTFDMKAKCARSLDGRAYAQSVDFTMVGSSFGKAINKQVRQSVINLKPVLKIRP